MSIIINMVKRNKCAWDPNTPVEANYYNWDGEPYILFPEGSPSRPNKFTLVDLFCGCGGLSVGFEMAGFLPVVGVDIHLPSIKTFQHNHPEAAAIVGDIRKAPGSMVLDAIVGQEIDAVAAGVPCQGFSLCNRKRWDQDERNFLFREFIRIVRLLNPKVVLLENVSGLRSAARGEFKRAIAEAIEEAGFYVDFKMLNAIDYGVPQRRERVFFMGVKPGLDIRWPKPTHGPRGEHPYVNVWDAIGDLPEIGPGETACEYDKEPFTEYQQLMRNGSVLLYNHEAPKHPPEVIQKIGSTAPGEPIYPKFKQRIRLHPDQPSPTQVSGGIRPQFHYGHPTKPRGLTVRERCRIQSFPDSFQIFGGVVQGRVQTGNAVPPLLACAIAEQIAGILRGDPKTDSALPKETAQMVLFPPEKLCMARPQGDP